MIETPDEFEVLFHVTREPLLAYLDRRVEAEDAADLLAELYLIAWRKRAELPPGDETRLWLFGVARRLVAEARRAVAARAEAVQQAAGQHDRVECPRGEVRGDAVRTALESLSELDRELITLTTWEQLTTAEAARVVGITAGTARVRLHRARARLSRHPRLRSVVGAFSDDGEDEAAGFPAALTGARP